MKKIFLLYAIIVVTSILLGCGNSLDMAASLKTRPLKIEKSVENEILETENKSKSTIKVKEEKLQIILNEQGYVYKGGSNNGSSRAMEKEAILEDESGNSNPGEDNRISEIELSYDEAQRFFPADRWYWLDNSYLYSLAENISFVTSAEDIVTGKYSVGESEVRICVFMIDASENGNFEFGARFPSNLYNIHQVDADYLWECFSYKTYNDEEWTSAVYANYEFVCEISFHNCDEELIKNTLASYSKI
ncbi:MAG: hypothetical protein ACI4VG_09820 [Lachnospiraceae bacterium]